MKLYFDSLTTSKVIHAESPIVIFFGTYGRYTLHYAQEKPRPPRTEMSCICVNFYKCMQKPGKAMGSHNNITDGEFCCQEHHKMFLVSWGVK